MFLNIKDGKATSQAKVLGFRNFHTSDGDISLYFARLSNQSYVVVKHDSTIKEYKNYSTYSEAYLSFSERLNKLESLEHEQVYKDKPNRPYSRIGV